MPGLLAIAASDTELSRFSLRVDGYGNRNSHLLDGEPELKEDAARMFRDRPLMEKTQVMTLLEAMRMHFG